MSVDPTLEARIEFTPALAAKLSRIGALLTKRHGRRSTLEEVLDASAEVFLNKIDPERRAERLALKVAAGKRGSKKETEKAKSKFETLVPSHLKIQALRRDRNQCSFLAGERRCGVKKRVDAVPVASKPWHRLRLKDVTTRCVRHRQRFAGDAAD